MLKIQNNVILSPYTTFKIGGPARHFVEVRTEEELEEAVQFAKTNNLQVLVIGGGSNLLISDAGFKGLVIRIEIKGISFKIEGENSSDSNINGATLVFAAAGENWENFVELVVEKGLYGIENLSSIPGTVGASPVQNIGAYGVDVSNCIHSVRVLDTSDMTFKELSNAECMFSYRDSLFKHEKGRYIITGVTFRLSKEGKVDVSYKDLREYFDKKHKEVKAKGQEVEGKSLGVRESQNAAMEATNPTSYLLPITSPSLHEVRQAVIEIRKNKLPDWTAWGTAGSFFKNPIVSAERWKELKTKYPELPGFPESDGRVKVSLGWILDKLCNAKGLVHGNVGTYEKQALVIVAKPGASAEEVIAFAEYLMNCVKEKTGLEIEGEVEWAVA